MDSRRRDVSKHSSSLACNTTSTTIVCSSLCLLVRHFHVCGIYTYVWLVDALIFTCRVFFHALYIFTQDNRRDAVRFMDSTSCAAPSDSDYHYCSFFLYRHIRCQR